MLRIKGEIGGDHFNIKCEDCGNIVHLSNLRWDNGGMKVTVTCPGDGDNCGTDEWALDVPTWIGIAPDA